MSKIFVLIVIVAGIFGIGAGFFYYPKFFQVGISFAKTKEINPREPLVVNFAYPMVRETVEKNTEIRPATEVFFKWENSNKKLSIIPRELWRPGEAYFIKINGGKNIMLVRETKSISFETIPYPYIKNFFPASGAKDVLVGIEDPIMAEFNKPLGDFKVKFAINPAADLFHEISGDGSQIKLLPRSDLRRGAKYAVEIYVQHKAEKNNYRKIYETAFETLPPLPEQWEKDLVKRLEQAKKFTNAKIKEGKYIDINLKIQTMVIFENGRALDAFLVSTGKRGMETPQGSFAIRNKSPRPWSKRYSLFMPYWNAIVADGKFGIHELPEWPGGYKEGEKHLGIPVSHGCVRLGIGPAQKVYEWAPIGTPVIIHD